MMSDKLTIGNIQQLTDEATKEYTSRGLLPNVAGQQELKLIKMQEEISRLQGEIREAYKCGYEKGHHNTVESIGYYPDEAADEYMEELQETPNES